VDKIIVFFGRLGRGKTLSFESVKIQDDSIGYHRFFNSVNTLNISVPAHTWFSNNGGLYGYNKKGDVIFIQKEIYI
jgi:hypothetical protein